MKGSRILSDEKSRRWFIHNYPEMNNAIIATYLGISYSYVGQLARKIGLKKSEDYLRSVIEYRNKRVRQFYESKKGDKDFFAFCKRERLPDGRFKKSQKEV